MWTKARIVFISKKIYISLWYILLTNSLSGFFCLPTKCRAWAACGWWGRNTRVPRVYQGCSIPHVLRHKAHSAAAWLLKCNNTCLDVACESQTGGITDPLGGDLLSREPQKICQGLLIVQAGGHPQLQKLHWFIVWFLLFWFGLKSNWYVFLQLQVTRAGSGGSARCADSLSPSPPPRLPVPTQDRQPVLGQHSCARSLTGAARTSLRNRVKSPGNCSCSSFPRNRQALRKNFHIYPSQ